MGLPPLITLKMKSPAVIHCNLLPPPQQQHTHRREGGGSTEREMEKSEADVGWKEIVEGE